MNRRVLLTTVAGGAAVLAGCIAGLGTRNRPGGEPTIQTESLSMEKGERGETTVVATNVKMVQGGGIRATSPGANVAEHLMLLETSSATITPPPSGGMDSFPPYWMWDSLQERVEIVFPIHIPPETPSGTYHATMRGWESTNYDNEPAASEDVTITIG